MKIPKKQRRYCKYCKKYTEATVSIAKTKGRSKSHPLSKGGNRRLRARGLRRGAGNQNKYSKPPKPKMTGKKSSKKTDLRYKCSECKKVTVQASGFRAKKQEVV